MKSPLWKETESHVFRILRPDEAKLLMKSVTMALAPRYLQEKYSTYDMKVYVSCLLLTGMRYPELEYLQKNEGSYLRKEGHVYLPMAATGKDKRKNPSRYVRLSDAGREEIDKLWIARPMPEMYQLDQLLHKWAERAGFEKWRFNKTMKRTVKDDLGHVVFEEYESPKSGKILKRPKKERVPKVLITNGVVIRSFRKTWESWLIHSFPEHEGEIIDSQGHDDRTAIKHYRNLIFDQEDKANMRPFVGGYF